MNEGMHPRMSERRDLVRKYQEPTQILSNVQKHRVGGYLEFLG